MVRYMVHGTTHHNMVHGTVHGPLHCSIGGCKQNRSLFFYVILDRNGVPFGNEIGLERVPHKSPRAHTQRGRSHGLYGAFGSLPGTISHRFGYIFDENHGFWIFARISGLKSCKKTKNLDCAAQQGVVKACRARGDKPGLTLLTF